MKLRFCKKCHAAMISGPLIIEKLMRALCETQHYVCPFEMPMCGKFVDHSGKPLAIQDYSLNN